ncbi:hypothetical protein KSS87_022840 [Heliosperma pusillum]|nr:hypothetical protein KSS87_022840 [Heliosperma pusillum]
MSEVQTPQVATPKPTQNSHMCPPPYPCSGSPEHHPKATQPSHHYLLHLAHALGSRLQGKELQSVIQAFDISVQNEIKTLHEDIEESTTLEERIRNYYPFFMIGIHARAATDKTIHDFTVKDIDGNDTPLSKFKGKVLLIVNVASKCGLTSSNYSELSQVYEKYKPQGLEILAFPCNQFGGQEPGSNNEIKNFACTRYKAEYPIFDKVDVNGPNTAPVYQFLKSSAGGFLGDLVKWNFEKFLVDKNGKVVERYPPTTSPIQIEV